MTILDISEAALQEIADIVDYIAAVNPDAADRARDAIFQACRRLAERPGLGHARPDLTELPLRFLTVWRRYMIAYRAREKRVEIVRVFGPGRDVSRLLR